MNRPTSEENQQNSLRCGTVKVTLDDSEPQTTAENTSWYCRPRLDRLTCLWSFLLISIGNSLPQHITFYENRTDIRFSPLNPLCQPGRERRDTFFSLCVNCAANSTMLIKRYQPDNTLYVMPPLISSYSFLHRKSSV